MNRKYLLLILLSLFFLCACGKQPPVETTGTPPVTTAAETTTAAPETSAAVPETTTIIPETTTPVPDTTTAEETTTAAPETTTAPKTTTASPETTVPDAETQEFVRRRGGDPGGEIIELIPLPEIPYERPDFERLFADMEALATQAAAADQARPLIEAYKDIRSRMTTAQTMTTLANFRYCLNTSDSYYSEEMNYTAVQREIMNQKHNQLLRAFADSPLRNQLESSFFGRKYFEYNVKNQNETYRELSVRETELVNQFVDTRLGIPVNYQGETKTMSEWAAESNEIWEGAYEVHITENYESFSELYLEIVRIRHQIALSTGFSNYMSFVYKNHYYRDYSLSRAGQFLERVKTYLVPILNALYEQNPDLHHQAAVPEFLKENPLDELALATEQMGGVIWEAFRFMTAYDLCDLEMSPGKKTNATTYYLSDYEVPIFHAFGGYLTPAHEFGHFVDLYRNYRGTYYEISEVFSTAMEYLAVSYNPSLDAEERAASLRAVLAHLLLDMIIECSARSDFLIQVYTVDPEELTPEKMDEMYYQCMVDYGLQGRYSEAIERGEWILGIQTPGYEISYPLACITSMQIILREEKDPGAGVEAYNRLLEMASSYGGIDNTLRYAKLESPFASETIEKTAAFLREALELP